MRHPYADLYSLVRHEPRAEEYFNRLPDYVQDQITARYRSVDSLERLHAFAAQCQRGPSAEEPSPIPEIGRQTYLPPPLWL